MSASRNEYIRQWRAKNKNAVSAINRRYHRAHRAQHAERVARWAKQNSESVCAASRKYYARNKENIRLRQERYRAAHPNYSTNYTRERAAVDQNFRLVMRLRKRVWAVVKGVSKSASTLDLLGCTISSFWLYLESKFEDGMTRENYGRIWEIDHKIPCALFDMTKADHQRRCFHFSNLQPLFVLANRSKGAKLLTQ